MRIYIFIPIITILCIFTMTDPSDALQTHGKSEGLYAQQLAHLFFIFCMGRFTFRICRSFLPGNQGWQFIALGSFLIMGWNLWSFAGHFIALIISEDNFILPEGVTVPFLHITSWKEILYYVLSMDHLLCVPALICFYLGLRRIMSISNTAIRKEHC